MRINIILIFFYLLLSHSHSFLEKEFQKSFNESCLKYDFVKQYWKSLSFPNGRYVVFVLNEPGLKNGGLGDRIGGILTSAMMALRFFFVFKLISISLTFVRLFSHEKESSQPR